MGIKSAQEIDLMRKGGKIAERGLRKLAENAKEGLSTYDLDSMAEDFIVSCGARPSFKGYEGYRFSTCINVNSGVVHGIPRERILLRKGDVVKIDLGVCYDGFHTDTATTLVIGQPPADVDRFLRVGRQALSKAIDVCRSGHRIGDLSSVIGTTVEQGGYGVVKDLVGHGVGRNLHESPQIPGFGRAGRGLLIKAGMTLAIEVIYSMGTGEIVVEEDGWTISTRDGTIAGLFEHTVLVTAGGVEILTS